MKKREKVQERDGRLLYTVTKTEINRAKKLTERGDYRTRILPVSAAAGRLPAAEIFTSACDKFENVTHLAVNLFRGFYVEEFVPRQRNRRLNLCTVFLLSFCEKELCLTSKNDGKKRILNVAIPYGMDIMFHFLDGITVIGVRGHRPENAVLTDIVVETNPLNRILLSPKGREEATWFVKYDQENKLHKQDLVTLLPYLNTAVKEVENAVRLDRYISITEPKTRVKEGEQRFSFPTHALMAWLLKVYRKSGYQYNLRPCV